MPYYRVRLKPKGPFFKGINSHARKSSAIVHSDVLHSAFFCVSTTMDIYLQDNKERTKSLLVSSIYPYYEVPHDDKNTKENNKEKKILYLYPKPFSPFTDDNKNERKYELDEEQKQDRKEWKKVKYVSEGLFVKLLTDKNAGKGKYEYLDDFGGDKGTTFCLKKELPEKKPSKKIVKENYKISTVIDRVTNKATPYPQNFYEINMEEGVGLWFFVKLEETEVEAFLKVLSALGELGIGGERSSGFGHFAITEMSPFESENIKLNEDKLVVSGHENLDLNAVTTLSLYHPPEEEFDAGILKGIASYECAVRGGWIHDIAGGSEPKQSVRMCIEGSIFPSKNGMPKGDVIDIVDISSNENSHEIWRSGLAFNIYFHYPHNEENQK